MDSKSTQSTTSKQNNDKQEIEQIIEAQSRGEEQATQAKSEQHSGHDRELDTRESKGIGKP